MKNLKIQDWKCLMKCKVNQHYILYYDRDRGNYRYASNKLSPIHISVGLNKEEMKAVN